MKGQADSARWINGWITNKFSGFKFRHLFIRLYILKPYFPQVFKTKRLDDMTSEILFNLESLGCFVCTSYKPYRKRTSVFLWQHLKITKESESLNAGRNLLWLMSKKSCGMKSVKKLRAYPKVALNTFTSLNNTNIRFPLLVDDRSSGKVIFMENINTLFAYITAF